MSWHYVDVLSRGARGAEHTAHRLNIDEWIFTFHSHGFSFHILCSPDISSRLRGARKHDAGQCRQQITTLMFPA